MKKTKRFLKDNRGAALISIMIAVAFVSILASALLYLSYSNFQMKVANYQSKVNFYGTEKDMTTLSTTIRNELATHQSDPEGALKTAVGHTVNGDIQRYDTAKLAKLVYSWATSSLIASDGMTINFNTNVPADQSNYLVTDEGNNVQQITLKGVVIEHIDQDEGYRHSITTDMIFHVKKSPGNDSAGGVGEFSVMTDSAIEVSGSTTRTVMYGNVYIGPGSYDHVTVDNITSPAGHTALSLKDASYYAQRGDYMIVFGDIKLQDTAVLNVASGKLTVFGNIDIGPNANFICNGDLYMPAGCQITGTTSNAKYNSIIEVSADDYKSVLNTIGIGVEAAEDGTTPPVGLLQNVMTEKGYKLLSSSGNQSETSRADKINYYGVGYQNVWFGEPNINNGNATNSLILNVKATTLQDGANLHSTLISPISLKITNQKTMILTQVGGDVFDILIAKDASEYSDFSEATHSVSIKNTAGGEFSAYQNGKKEVVGKYFFEEDCNEVANDLLGFATGNDGGETKVDTSVGYANWTKE